MGYDEFVLYIEDDIDDFDVFREVTEQCSSVRLIRAKDSIEAFRILAPSVRPDDFHYPCLILLDLNLPGMPGNKVLEGIRGNPATSHIPVVVMTTSSSPVDMRHVIDLGCSGYFIKPSTMNEVSALAEQLVRQYCPHTERIPGAAQEATLE